MAIATAPRPLLLHYTRNGAFGEGGRELVVMERGDGVYIIDTEGRRYLDGLSSLFCAQLGYGFGPEVAAVAAAQIEHLPFANNWDGAHTKSIELAERVTALAPANMNHVYFTSGGSESVEAAWKFVRTYHRARGDEQRTKAIARDRAYHGSTLGALALTGIPAFKDGPDAIPTTHISNTNSFRRAETEDELTVFLLAELDAAIQAEGPDTIAMFIAEPVQNAGGCFQPPAGYWPGVRAICDKYGILLVADEVITGFGRLGEWFASTRFDVAPDVITVAKGLTSAHAPMGAVLVTDHVAAPLYEAGRVFPHGVTFGGHPLCSAIALKNIEIFEREGVLDNVRANEAYLGEQMQTLSRLPIVGDVRGSGYFWATELVRDPDTFERFDAEEREELLRVALPPAFQQAGLVARGDDRCDTVVQVAPPLVCDRALLDELVERLGHTLEIASKHMHIPTS